MESRGKELAMSVPLVACKKFNKEGINTFYVNLNPSEISKSEIIKQRRG